MSEIRFGTNGWRGVLGRDFSVEGARALAAALARELGAPRARPRILVAFDTRAHAAEIAREAAAVMAGAGAEPWLCGGPAPTPIAGFLVRARRALAGFVVTASHNPTEFLGVKILAAGGESAPRAWADRLALAGNALAGSALATGEPRAIRDPPARYVARLEALLEARAIRRARPRVLYDAMHGTGSGTLDRLLRALGARVEVMRGAADPRFGGGAPDPIAARLRKLMASVRAGRFALGLATDGDADRFALVDAGGRLLSETESLALLVDHLAATRRLPRGLAISIATGRLAERSALARGLPVARLPLGFGALTTALREGRADVAGEESGGFAWRRVGTDKDGILAGALCVEAVALGAPLGDRLSALVEEHGASACGRIAIAADPGVRCALAQLESDPPSRWNGAPVREVGLADGVRLGLDDGFVYWRASGTEPVIRVYAEAASRAALSRRLRAATAELR